MQIIESKERIIFGKDNSVSEDYYMMPFGKYRGRFMVDVLRKDPNYYTWVLDMIAFGKTKDMMTKIKEKTNGRINEGQG